MTRHLDSPTATYGVPSAYARTLAARHRTHVVGASLVAIGLVLAGVSLHALLWIVLPVAGLFYYVQGERQQLAKASVGVRSEVRVARVLGNRDYEAVMHGMLLGAGGDCDHVVAGPVLCAIETKTGHGTVSYRDGVMTASGRRIPKDPVAQVVRQARALHRLTAHPVFAVVCVVDMTNGPFLANFESTSVVVCSLAALTSVIEQSPRVLGPGEATRFAEMISAHQAQIATQRPAHR